MKKYLKSKTLLFSMSLGILGAVQANLAALQLDAKAQGLSLMAIGISTAILRFLTTQPLDDK